MSDPFRTTAAPDSPETQPDRDARIEALLVTGLDHFVCGQYEQAINVWTRVHFIDRNHARARAYIERARRAMAERQRESDELLHRGVEAFERGDTGAAHALISRAVEQIGPTDLASALLDRLSRLQAGGGPLMFAGPNRPSLAFDGVTAAEHPAPRRARRLRLPMGVTLAVVVVVVLGLAAVLAFWATEPQPHPDVAGALAAEPLPVVTDADVDIARARALFAGGHLRDALAALESASRREPLRGDVAALRMEIQQRILEPRPRTADSTVGGGPR